MPQTNHLTFVVIENEWRSYRGPKKTFVCGREIPGAEAQQSVVLDAKDFVSADNRLRSWDQIDQSGICAHFAERVAAARQAPAWKGPGPTFTRLAWI